MEQNKPTLSFEELAEKHHGLVFSFLKSKKLPEADFYDVVVFGYMSALHDYIDKPEKRKKYSVSTMAYRSMEYALRDHYKLEQAQKRNGWAYSMDAPIRAGSSQTLGDIMPGVNLVMNELEEKLLMHEIAERVSEHQMAAIRLKVDGYGVRAIAKMLGIKMEEVKSLLASAYDDVRAVCSW